MWRDGRQPCAVERDEPSRVRRQNAYLALAIFTPLVLARRRLRPARRIRQFDRDGCRTAGFSRLVRILERQDQREVNGETQRIKLDLSATSFAFQGF